MLMHPGPGVDGPGPGVSVYNPGMPSPQQSSQVYFVGPEGMHVNWDVTSMGAFDSEPMICPGRYNFPQAAIYRLKLSDVPGRPGTELYPTLEVGPALPRTDAFLAHNAIPVQFTEEDFDQVQSGNFVTKVIYLPDPEYQELAVAGVETLVSTRLDPGVDPIVEADRRGAIMAIVRLGNKDLQMPGGMAEGGIMQTTYLDPVTGQPCPMGMYGDGSVPMGMPVGTPTTMPMSYPVAGVTMPQWGMPYCGTPIGLPGPPHIPLGTPAGLQKHVMVNHTRSHLPGPTSKVKIDVKQKPGFSYPKPAHHARIVERTSPPMGIFRQPSCNKHQTICDSCPDYGCPDETPIAPCPMDDGGEE
ncbi:MAG: hypothetical protein JXB10_06835 [Pirellulales bacterium]|nr:hypothetical protein [Pirellulales bacterium]